MDKSSLLDQEMSRFDNKKKQFTAILKQNLLRLNRIIGSQRLVELTKNILDPSKVGKEAHTLIKTLMLQSRQFSDLYKAAIAVASAADELQITQEETTAVFTTIKQLLISIPYEHRQMLAQELIRTQVQQPVASIVNLILHPENISQEDMPFPLVWIVFSQSADKEFSSFQTHFDSYKMLRNLKNSSRLNSSGI